MHKKALAEDSSIFDYDGAYDKFKQETVRPLAQDKTERKVLFHFSHCAFIKFSLH